MDLHGEVMNSAEMEAKEGWDFVARHQKSRNVFVGLQKRSR